MIEESRTNLLKYSVDFASIPGYNANYSNARSTLSSTTEVAPDGTNTASKYVRTAGQGNGEVAIIIGNTLGLSNGTVYTSSIFVKNVGTSGIVEFVNVRASDANDDSQFNLANGTITTDGSNNSLTTITPYPNDWYRISVTATMNNLSGYFWIRTYNQPEGSGFIIWGGQVEAGAFPTSYIPTYYNASVTRGNESFEIDGEDFTDFFNATESTVLSHITPLNGSLGNHSGTGGVVWSFDAGGSFGNGLYFSNANSTTAFGHSVVVGSSGQNTGGGTGNLTNGVPFKNATIFKKDDFIMATNGTLASADTSGNLPTVVKLMLGNNGWGNALNAANIHFNRFAYYPKRLPNTQLVTLTS